MQSLLEYLLKLSASLGVVYLFYFLFLRRLTFYTCNRWYLLLYTAGCFLIPFVDVSTFLGENKMENNSVINNFPSLNLNSVTATAGRAGLANNFLTNGLSTILPFIFLTGAIILLIRLGLQYFSFICLKRKAELINHKGIKIYTVQENIVPFSIGNSIFINSELQNNIGLKEIIRHEFVHVKQKHTIDILFTEILCILNWYNPFAWLIRHSVRQNLEFIADKNVLQNGFSRKEYQYLLLKVIGVSQFSIAQQFNFSSLKKRIIMMNKIKSARVHLLRFLFVLPLSAILLLAFRENNIAGVKYLHPAEINPNNVTDTVPGKIPSEVKSINVHNSIATVKLKNGKIEKYDMNNEQEVAAFTKVYGPLPTPPPPPPVPPVAPIAPIPPQIGESTLAPVPPLPPLPSIEPIAPLPPQPPGI